MAKNKVFIYYLEEYFQKIGGGNGFTARTFVLIFSPILTSPRRSS